MFATWHSRDRKGNTKNNIKSEKNLNGLSLIYTSTNLISVYNVKM